MWRWVIVGCLVLGCDDGGRSRVDGVDPDGPDGGALDAAAPDGEPADAMARVDMASPENCRFEIEVIPTSDRPDYEPIVDGDTVYFTEVGPEGTPRTVRARDRMPVGGPSDRLLAAHDGAFLLARPDGDRRQRLIYRDADGDVALSGQFDWPLGGEMQWRPPQWVAPGDAIWLEEDRLYRWRDGVSLRVDAGVIDAVLSDGRVAWVKRGAGAEGATEVWIDGVKRLDAPGAMLPGMLRATDTRVWVGSRQQLTGVAWGDAPDFECRIGIGATALGFDSVGDVAVLVGREGEGGAASTGLCGARSSQVGWGTTVVPRWLGDELIVAEWDDAQAWCQPGAPGRIGWPGPNLLTERLLAPIGTGCLCCGAYWPRLTIETGRDTIAWNYAVGDEGAWGIGIARRVCD